MSPSAQNGLTKTAKRLSAPLRTQLQWEPAAPLDSRTFHFSTHGARTRLQGGQTEGRARRVENKKCAARAERPAPIQCRSGKSETAVFSGSEALWRA